MHSNSLSARDRYEQILTYLSCHIHTRLTIAQICRDNFISRTQLEKLFHDFYGGGVMDCFVHLKMDAAQKLLRTQRFSIKQISSYLGYSSVQYFSLQFKKQTGLSPSAYRSLFFF